jgi:hypothetical protein
MRRFFTPHAAVVPTLALALAAQARPVAAQTFTKLTDASNPVVADAGAPAFAGASWIDVDADGNVDLFVGDRGLYRHLGGGTFVRVLIPNNIATTGNSWSDADNDGDADLMVASGSGGGHGSRFWRNDGWTFTQITTGVIGDSLANVGWACAWGDYDADGFTDLVIAQAQGFTGSGPNHLLHNRGDGTFEYDLSTDVTVGTAPYTIPSWSDFDLDGDLDLSIGAGPATGALGPDYFYRNLRIEGGTPLLDRITTGALATDLRDGQVVNWIDYDNDGDLDCYITNWLNRVNHLYRNDAGTYVRMTGPSAGPIVSDVGVNASSVWNDYDNDGDLDCVVGRSGGNPCRYYRNEGNGSFTSQSMGSLTSAPAPTVVAADYDRDGDVDLYASASGPSKGLYRNDLANGNRWLEVRLTGTESNRSAIGARIRVLATIGGQPVWQMREVSAQNSFNGHSEFTLHVGLGDATQVQELRVEWPLGRVERFENLPVNELVALIEGQNGPTPTLAALVASAVSDRGVELTWQGDGLDYGAGITVERLPEGGAWSGIGAPIADGSDRVTFVDATATPGRWAYRLRLPDARVTSEAWVEVPAATLRLRALGTEAAGGRLGIEFALPHAGAARIEVLDAGGRRVASRDLGTLAAGRRTLQLDVPSLPPGLYWLRLSHGGRSITARAVVLR